MAGNALKILGVHGLGDHRDSTWRSTWEASVRSAFPAEGASSLSFSFVTYDDIFEKTKISFGESVKALWKLGKSGAASVVRKERGVVSEISDKIRWTAGYVVAWVEDEGFKLATRERILDALKAAAPDVILAHSLGSLITYNAFSHADAETPEIRRALAGATYVTLGSQIGNPFVIKNLTPGRIESLPVRRWRHLYNEHDDAFTAELKLWNAQNFSQINTPFDADGVGDHAAESYLSHPNAIESLWRPLSVQAIDDTAFGPERAATRASAKAPSKSPKSAKSVRSKRRRALLVGINDYPNKADRLDGCVNDVFLMSSVLQECGFDPSEIRICLDDRATKKGMLDRLKWVLDEPRADDERVFYYSGHGARIPEYGEDYEPDHHVETLVPWDFDWTREKAITDDEIFSLYSQLPFDCRLMMIFDCCHSGGVHRDGGARSRGISPPDDIRHRELKWDRKTEMWVERDFRRLNRGFAKEAGVEEKYFGSEGATLRIGRASMLRGLTASRYAELKKADPKRIIGPYLPLIIEACEEHQLSFEYRHGVSSYGAFTYSLAGILRREKNISFDALVTKTAAQLADLQYDQVPQILGPAMVRKAKVPWLTASPAPRRRKKSKKAGK
jgi:hypothetical protein